MNIVIRIFVACATFFGLTVTAFSAGVSAPATVPGWATYGPIDLSLENIVAPRQLPNSPLGYDIYRWNSTLMQESDVTPVVGSQVGSAISANTVVWLDSRNSQVPPYGWDVYMKNLITGVETRLTPVSGPWLYPKISGNYILLQNMVEFGTVHIYHVDTGVTDQVNNIRNSGSTIKISGAKLLYMTWGVAANTSELRLHDTSTRTELTIAVMFNSGVGGAPCAPEYDIAADQLAYVDVGSANCTLQLVDLSTNVRHIIASSPGMIRSSVNVGAKGVAWIDQPYDSVSGQPMYGAANQANIYDRFENTTLALPLTLGFRAGQVSVSRYTVAWTEGDIQNPNAYLSVHYATVAPILGDVDASGCVDSADMTIILHAWGARVGSRRYNPRADLNHDGIINHKDLELWSANVGKCVSR